MSGIERTALAPPAQHRRIAWGRVLQVVTLILGVALLARDVASLLHNTGLQPMAGRIDVFRTFAPGRPGWYVVEEVEPGGPAARARIRVGDRLRLDRPVDNFRAPRAGEVFAATLERGATRRRVDLVAMPIKAGAGGIARKVIEAALASILPALFGLFIAARSRGRLVVALFGLSFLFFGNGPSAAPFWMTAPLAIWANLALYSFTFPLTGTAGAAFAMLFSPEGTRRLSPLQLVSLAALAACGTALATVSLYEDVTVTDLHLAANALQAVVLSGGLILFWANLIWPWLKGPPKSRGRYAVLMAEMMLMYVSTAAGAFVELSLGPGNPRLDALTLIFHIVSGLVAPALITYAILRNRVLDLGFAVNRTLVFGVLSVILLATFGLIEWAVDHFVPIAGREKNVLVDAAVAVGVFLSFHRVRDFVEHVIEGLFFRRWQEAEAQLRGFVKQAAFVENGESLMRSFMAALTRFADGAEAALYVRPGEGPYRRASGAVSGLDEAIDPDDPALIALRADPKPRELDAASSTIEAALIAPMVNRNRLGGFALLGPKPSGLPYRPDEIELIGWATGQISLDLHALKVERLEEADIGQRRRIGNLQARNRELRFALGARHRG